MLKVSNLCVRYGMIEAVRGLSLTVKAGETVVLLGANGAGKSSTISAIAGLVASSGSVVFDGEDISRLQTEDRVRRNLTVTPEGRKIFANLTVTENLALGGALRSRSENEEDMDQLLSLFPILKQRHTQSAGTLSGGEQQMLAIARSLMSRPKFLMLDEPSLGLAPKIVEQIFEHIRVLKERSLTLLIVEQNVVQALKTADRAYVMASGCLQLEGKASDLASNDSIIKAYLGG